VIQGLTPAAKATLQRYPWPGNVRELQNAIERAAVLCETSLIDCTDLPDEILFYRGGFQASVAPVQALSASGVDADGPSSDQAAASLAAASPADAELRLLPNELSIKKVTERVEQALIRRALLKTRGNRSAAAKLLELSHRALLYKLRDYGLAEKSVAEPDSGPDESS
jgi:two-component system response regulator AtoC